MRQHLCLRSIVVLPVAMALVLAFYAVANANSDVPLFRNPAVVADKPDLASLPRLRFITSLDFPPFNFADETRKASGFNVDLARAICAVLAVEAKCEIQALPWEELKPALLASRAEAIIAGNGISAQKRTQFGLTEPYFRFPARFVAKKEATGLAVSDPLDFYTALKGQKVAVVEGSAHAIMLETGFPEVERVLVQNELAAYEALSEDRAAAIFGDGVVLSFWLSAGASEACCQFVSGAYYSEQFLGKGMVIMVKKSDEQLLQGLEHALTVIERTGMLDEIHKRYFPLSPFSR